MPLKCLLETEEEGEREGMKEGGRVALRPETRMRNLHTRRGREKKKC